MPQHCLYVPNAQAGAQVLYVKDRGTETWSGMVPRGLEPQTLRLLAVRSNQLSYET